MDSSSSQSSIAEVSPRKLDGLEALRGVAAVVVLLHHAFGSLELPQNFNTRLVWGFFEEGNLGVNIFFVLSGFVIAWSNPKDGRTFRDVIVYVLRRLSRVFPMYWVACLFILPVYWKFAPASLGEASAGRMLHDFFLLPYGETPMLQVAWTLVFEIMFYLLFVPMLLSHRAAAVMWTMLVAAILVCAAAGVKFDNLWAGHLFSLYVLQFVAGMVVCRWTMRHPLSPKAARRTAWAGGILIFLAAAGERITGGDWVPANLHYAAFAAIAVLGIVNLPDGIPPGRGRAWRILRILGRYSFSIYLFHVPVQKIVIKVAVNVLGMEPGLPMVWVVALVSIAVSLTVGILMGRFFEMPMLEWCKKQISRLKPRKPVPAQPAAAPVA